MATETSEMPLKILALEIADFKGVKVFSLDFPAEGEIRVSGSNGAGKSSVLDAIAVLIGGPKLAPDRPIRDGADEATIVGDLGPFKIKRRFRRKPDGGIKSDMDIITDDPDLARSQKMLDALYDEIGFDPSIFVKLKPSEQRDVALGLIGAKDSLAKLDAERSEVYSRRTNVNRDVDKLRGQASGFPSFAGLPEKEESVAALTEELLLIADAAKAHSKAAGEVETLRQEAARSTARAKARQDEMDGMKKKFEDLKVERDKFLAEAVAIDERRKASEEALKGVELKDDAPIRLRISEAEKVNARVRERARCREVEQLLATRTEESAEATKRIEEIDAEKAALVSNAKLPIEGLGFNEFGVLYRGIPLVQCSASEQMRVGIAIGMAQHPRLRCILNRDGSLLDRENLAVVREITKGLGYQLLVERVAERNPKTGAAPRTGIFIEEGEVTALDGVDVGRGAEMREKAIAKGAEEGR